MYVLVCMCVCLHESLSVRIKSKGVAMFGASRAIEFGKRRAPGPGRRAAPWRCDNSQLGLVEGRMKIREDEDKRG